MPDITPLRVSVLTDNEALLRKSVFESGSFSSVLITNLKKIKNGQKIG